MTLKSLHNQKSLRENFTAVPDSLILCDSQFTPASLPSSINGIT